MIRHFRMWTQCAKSYLAVSVRKRDGFGMNELLGVAAALIIAAFVVIPGLRTFAGDIMTHLTTWWNGTITGRIFPTT